MDLFFRTVLQVHIVAGAVALLVFWVPLVTKKGGRAHRGFGWVYVGAAAVIAVTSILRCVYLVSDGRPGRWRAGVFLAYVALFAGESAYLGVRALRSKTARETRPRRMALDLVPPSLLVLAGIALVAFGLAQARVLFVLFAVLGAAQGTGHIRFWLRAPATGPQRVLAHMGAMGTSCITTLTAFVVVNGPRLGMQRFDVRLWAGPIVALGIGLTLWMRSWATRFAASAPPDTGPYRP